MDINNNQQINTFTKGMNTDVSDMLMDNSQYKYAENVRLVTNVDGNSGELRMVDGTESAGLDSFPGGTIKGMTSIRDVMIVVGYKNNRHYIYVHKIGPNNDWVCAYESKIGEDFGEYLSLVTRYENDKLIKLYIADGVNQLMYINLAPYINFTGSAPQPLEGIDSIIINIEEFISPIKASLSPNAGQVPGVKVQYAYRYYKLGGAATQISPMSNVVTIYKTANEGFTEVDKTTSKSVKLELPVAPQGSMNMMQIYRISYIQIGQLPTVNIIYDDELMSGVDYIDTGYNVQSVDSSEFLSTVRLSFIPKVIESKNNYLFAANIEYIQSDIDSKIDDDAVRCLSTGDYDNGSLLNYNKQLNSENIMQFDPENWLICDSQGSASSPRVLGGKGQYIQWSYNIRPVAIDRENRKYLFNSQSVLQETTEQLASLRQGEVYRYGAIFYDSKGNRSSVKWIADIMSPMLSVTNTNDLYRYQFSRGDTMFPKFNITASSSGNANFTGISSEFFYTTYQIGIDFKVLSLPVGIVGVEIVRVNRSVSDRITITEGIGGFPYRVYHKQSSEEQEYLKTQYICPTGYITTTPMYADSFEAQEDDNFIRLNRAVSDNEFVMFSSPEYVYQSDDIKNIINSDKNSIQIDTKYNMHCNLNIYSDVTQLAENDDWSVENKPSSVSSQNAKYYLQAIGTTGIDIQHSSYFIVPNFIPTFVSQKINSQYLQNVNNVWCFNERSAYYNSSELLAGQGARLMEESVGGNPRNIVSAYVGLAAYINNEQIDDTKFSIKNVGYPTVPAYDHFFGSDEHLTNWANDVAAVGSGTTYSCWGSPLIFNVADPVGHMKNDDTLGSLVGISKRFPVLYPTGSTGKCIVLQLANPMKFSSWHYTASNNTTLSTMSFPLMRIRKIGVTPYGGYGTIKNSTYISNGNIIKSGYTARIFDGDCYPGLFVYNASHAWYEPNTPAGIKQMGVYMIPVESDVDLSATWGDTYNKVEAGSDDSIQEGTQTYYIQDKASAVSANFVQNKDAYLYNTAYGAQPNLMTYSSIKYTEIDTSACDTRVHHSQPKVNGEHIDNWLNFKTLDFLDVDSRFGEITNMRLFKDTMLYWQNNATGILSINERTVLNDASDNQIILGTGDVLQRYDYVSTIYGMLPNQYEAETQSSGTQYFWDGQNKEIVAYSGGMEVTPLTKVKNAISYINGSNSVLHPSLSYDKKFNELISSVVDNGSIIYNEQTQCFTSVYTFNPTYRAVINDRLYYNEGDDIYRMSINQPQNAHWFGSNANPLIRYVVNSNAQYPKVFDISTFGGRFYGGDNLQNITFNFYTPLKQHSVAHGNQITNREYDFRLDIPRNADSSYGDRMRGKTMQCELSSSSNSTDFSLQYIVTKYRMSWS